MRRLIKSAAVFVVFAATAQAGVPAGALSPLGKAPRELTGHARAKAGMLDCSGAVEIALDNTYFGDNTGLLSNVNQYGCNPWYEPGGEVVFHLYLAEPAMWEATIAGDGCDLDLAVLDQCDEDAGCLIVADTGVVTNAPVFGDLYFVVDGYAEEGCSFTFTITELDSPEPTTFCDLVETMTGTYFYGYTCGGTDLVNSQSCGAYSENGLEAYYEIFMPAGSAFTATVTSTADGALWLLDGCGEPFNCLAFADETLGGDPEVISYLNAGSLDRFVYLVVDSYGVGTCGSYDVDFSSTNGAVAVESMNLGSVKALFR